MLSINQDKRLWFIELIAWWEGRISASHLMRQFGISRTQAQKDILYYHQLLPGNLLYHASYKGFLPQAAFQQAYISGDVVEYLNWVSHQDAITDVSTALPYTTLALPKRQVSAEIIRVLVTAIRQKRRVEVDYVSVSNPDRQGRIIVPHHFVSAGLRWHLRAFCEKSNGFRDFVLSRFRGVPELMNKTNISAEQDSGWTTELYLEFQPDPRLKPAQQEVLHHDYQMQKGKLLIHTRACLAQYVLQEMQVNIRDINISPEAQQLVLVNLNDIKPWLFEEKS
ncbi:MAG: WYL domain-containing protein [Gammaproteobacteria bacterium]|nr:WYL domain-containing protein [Gammaproteobacteria bacterium]MBU2057113.1 WYL domain-containing protein [Gammaproteobacteria bacterium]MBU2175172.1 WYL domain-containing protein [Gammaproteobacteria bacterium]MBU2245203.1 WYL domain-containing protein [Gammaproteobacteria bacterium]MBU2346055.1 WYL domain-containing protein [Gammaproteobacteria bacterium]